MYGFIGTWKWKEPSFQMNHPDYRNGTAIRYIEYKDFKLLYQTNGKFMNDKVFYEDNDVIICLDGLIYNSLDFIDKNELMSISRIIKDKYNEKGREFINDIDGVFSLVLFDKKMKSLFLMTDHTAMKPLFYYVSDGAVFFSTDITWLYRSLHSSDITLRLNLDAAYCLLSYGFMIDDLTLVSGLFKVLPGRYIVFDGRKKTEYTYFDYLKISEKKDNYNTLLQKAEITFSKAVKKRYNKDLEYGYNHVCTLSGGLDSRSILFVSYDLGFLNQMTLTMSQSNTLDEKIAKQISSRIGVGNFFYMLDNGDYLRSVDRAVEINGGLVTYPGLMHSERLFSLFNFEHYGAIHSGEVGDAIFGGHNLSEYREPANSSYGAFSTKLLSHISQSIFDKAKNRCNSKYMFFLLERGLNSTVNGWYSATPFTEYTSAFLDREFLKLILSIPAEYRAKSRFYIDWMKKYHPQMCLFKWEKTNALPTARKCGKGIGLAKKNVSKIFGGNPENMNPYELWLKNNISLYKYVKQYYREKVQIVEDKELKKSMQELFIQGTFFEKAQILTLLGAIWNFKITV